MSRAFLLAHSFNQNEQRGDGKQLPERSALDPHYQWRLEDIFPTDEAWEEEFARLEKDIPRLETYQGQLADEAGKLLACLQLRDQLEERLGRLFLYAGLKNDQDTRVARYQAFRDRASQLATRYHEASAFIEPELLAIPEDRLEQFFRSQPELELYRHYLDNVRRLKAHVLPAEQERLLAMAGEVARGPYTIFSMFNNADIRFPSITDEEGREVEVTKARYQQLIESPDRRVRHDAFHAFYGSYVNWLNTLAATLSTAIKKNIFYARARGYGSALEAALAPDNIPVSVYTNVLEAVGNNLQPLHRFLALRRKRLNLKQLEPWDLFAPIVHRKEFQMAYPEAMETVLAALSPLGEEYLSVLQEAFQGGWIDVYENQGKRSGAYSWGTYGVHPYVLLNYTGTYRDVFTLAHEMGHAMHSYFSQKHQPYVYSHYTIFVAEVASTLNEALLIHHLLEHTSDPEVKLFLLNEYADQIRSTVYIQTMFADLEKQLHEAAEQGRALTAEYLNELNGQLTERYLGPAVHLHPWYRANWCRIPHFYYNFYVYKYVTGYAAATALARRILAGEQGAREAYLRFLSRGSSDYSLNLLRDAGVDMTGPEPLQETTRLLDELVSQMAEMMNLSLE
ncbi:MAG: oligoendopeptidase F [Calditrichaeota bacterium]|nr:MAG: oligoendopeptidase F [Calditrichota bacterium]